VFDVGLLNKTVAGAFCQKSAAWGGKGIQVDLTIEPTIDEETYRIAGKSITADCLADGIESMKRGDLLTIDAVQYSVLSVHRDGTGWATIALEEA
jgi:hypothetical protein